MSSTKLHIALVAVLFLSCTHCRAAEGEQLQQQQQPQQQQQQPVPVAATASKAVDNTDQLDQGAIMQMCNESFRTTMGLYSMQ